jgi:hypothetical protein
MDASIGTPTAHLLSPGLIVEGIAMGMGDAEAQAESLIPN